MAIPSSGTLRFSAIQFETSSPTASLRAMSNIAGFSTPDSVSEFYGYINVSYIGNFAANNPCNYDYYDIYYGNVDGYYYYWTGTSYVFALNYATNWYQFDYYDSRLDVNIYDWYETVYADSWNYLGQSTSAC